MKVRSHRCSRKVALITAALVVLAGGGAGIAWAVIPDTNGVIHGCYYANATPIKAFYLADPLPGDRACPRGMTAITFNQTGPPGPPGPPGPSGTAVFAQFYALMPPDNPATVPPGGAVDFPQNGPQSGSIARLTHESFQLGVVGTYRVSFVVPVTEPGQLQLRLNGIELAYTTVGRSGGSSQLVGESLVQTTTASSVLEVVNPSGSILALTVTPLAGGSDPVSASLVIQKLG